MEIVPARFQSTHPRGVRLCHERGLRLIIEFQSTHPRGVRLPLSGFLSLSRLFQSTHPRGVRLVWRWVMAQWVSDFNPRTHVGCDLGVELGNLGHSISIHAPTWGATQQTKQQRNKLCYFNPRTHVGCDLFPGLTRVWRTISIHAPTWDATFERALHRDVRNISIHAPTWGATCLYKG